MVYLLKEASRYVNKRHTKGIFIEARRKNKDKKNVFENLKLFLLLAELLTIGSKGR